MISIVGYLKRDDYVNVDVVYDDDYKGHSGKTAFTTSIKADNFDKLKVDKLPFDITGKLEVGAAVREGKYLSRYLTLPRF